MKRKNLFQNVLSLLILISISLNLSAQKFDKKLQKYCESVITDNTAIGAERSGTLNEIVTQIVQDLKRYETVQPLFICTHNSRRSHMAQLWLHTAAEFYGIDSIKPYSGGTEATAFNKNAIEALQRAGFTITPSQIIGNQQTYLVSTGRPNVERLIFSKKFDNPINPKKEFFAVMVCSEADKSCPLVPGADARFSLPYDDPRYFDGTPSVSAKYDETCRLIAHEMFYLMEKVKDELNKDAEINKK